jgi:hypothetical protein
MRNVSVVVVSNILNVVKERDSNSYVTLWNYNREHILLWSLRVSRYGVIIFHINLFLTHDI